MDAQEALRIAADKRRLAARDRTPGWYPPAFAGLWAVGAVALGSSLVWDAHGVWLLLLTGVWIVAWAALFALAVAMSRRGGIVRWPASRTMRQRWIDNAPSLVVVVIAAVVWLTAGVGWMMIVVGIGWGVTELFRLVRMRR